MATNPTPEAGRVMMVVKVVKKPERRPEPVEHKYQRDPERELAELRDYAARSERLREMRPELLKKYPDQHVSLTENGVLVVAPTAEEAVAKIEELGERPGFAARMRLNTKPRPRRIPG